MKNLSSLTIILIFLTLPSLVLAANPLSVVINEIAWMGTKIDGIESKNWWRYEWVVSQTLTYPLYLG